MNPTETVLVIGSGIAGMEASLMLSKAGKKVFLVERLPLIGGNVIKTGESFPNMECSTCLVAPIQQEILQDSNIEVLTVSDIISISGKAGDFAISVRKRARYVNIGACLGCGMCYPVCPVTQPNNWEQNLVEKKAIFVECAGSLPNVPVIDPALCLRLNGGEECNLCMEACMFGAIDFSEKEEILEINAGAVIVAAGFETIDAKEIENLGYGKYPGVFTAYELERLLASNGPTEGKLRMRDGETKPGRVAIIHCAGRDKVGYCSNVCCSYSARHAHFMKEKLPEVEIFDIYSDLCLPDKHYQKLNTEIRNGTSSYIYQSDIAKMKIEELEDKLLIQYLNEQEAEVSLEVDMLILTVAIKPAAGLEELADLLEIEIDKYGFIKTAAGEIGSVCTSRSGIFVAGCAEGPKDIPCSVLQSEAAVAQVMRLLES
ncbi:MAG: FAD-dependent oxidoreductase [Candidatus Cloacimonetes bacterium]|nr:FAD-dependent oxidoreductase [Candidatus Cloacimonadota bacterium]